VAFLKWWLHIEGSKLKDFSLIAMFGWRWAQEKGQRQVVYAKGGFLERLLSCRYRIEGLGEKYYYLVGIEFEGLGEKSYRISHHL